jgi:D-3-phosphoglycerate dehydrogenase / 2-oxoglutarate reductase
MNSGGLPPGRVRRYPWGMSRPASRPPAPFLVLDFDSTLAGVESLDALFGQVMAELAPEGRARLEARFQALTDAGMGGERSQADTLRERLALFPPGRPHRADVKGAAALVSGSLAPSALRQAQAFRARTLGLLVVSGGFQELITPAAARLGIPGARVVAHAFRAAAPDAPDALDAPGTPLELDPDTPMARGGKVGAVRDLLEGGRIPRDRPLWVVGDGATDLELRTAGLAERFVAFTEIVTRPAVVAAADHVVSSFDHLFHLLEASP